MLAGIRAVAPWIIAAAILFAFGAADVAAQASASYSIPWDTVSAGGGTSTSASYRVMGTVGQASAGPAYSTSATYLVNGGFWGRLELWYRLFAPHVSRP